MTMRPFKFFLLLALALMFFSGIGRFLIFGFIAATIGLAVLAIRRATNRTRRRERGPVWKNDLLMEYPGSPAEEIRVDRVIEVR